MKFKSNLLNKIPSSENELCDGNWRSIRFTPDLATEEFLNIGIQFKTNNNVSSVRMLDYFGRLECLYDKRIDEQDFTFLLNEIESSLLSKNENFDFGSHISFSEYLYASGENSDDILNQFYDDIVTLGKIKSKKHRVFRYVSNPRLRLEVLDNMRQSMALKANRFIQEEPYRVPIKSGNFLETELPLVGKESVGAIVSSYYKSPLVIAHNILNATSEISLAFAGARKKRATLSLLRPGDNSGLTKLELKKVDEEFSKQVQRAEGIGIEVLQGTTVAEVSEKTTKWWNETAA